MEQKDFFKRYWGYFFSMIGAVILMIVHLSRGNSGIALIWGVLGLIWAIRIYLIYKRNSKDE